MNEVWIVKSKVADPSPYVDAKAGQTEYQFSDGPSGNRSCSDDYIDLEQGLQHYSGYVIHWEG